MFKSIVLILLLMIQPMFAWAESDINSGGAQSQTIVRKDESGKVTELLMTSMDAIKLAGNLVDRGDYEHASQILTMMPETDNTAVETERWYLLAQIFQRTGDYDDAIKIYREILDERPDLAKVRYELALCYMAKEQWYRADYQLRLAMAGDDIPQRVKQQMMYYRYVARQNKRWNVWFNFGAAPDNNVNQATGGNECIMYGGYPFCHELPKPEKAIGYNLSLGGNYEFVLSDQWRWKNEANIYINMYDKHQYDDLYLSVSSGPRYIWENGDVWLAGIASRRWYGGEKYNWSAGGKLDTHYDWTRKFSTGLSLRVMQNTFDENGKFMDGETYSVAPYATYSIDSSKYLVWRGGIDRDTAGADAYADWRYGTGIGFGAELPWGFNLYLEPYFSWVKYDGPRWAVEDNAYQPVKERDFLQRYTVSLSNNKIDVLGFVPTLTFSYTSRDSNIHSREYDKFTTEFSFRQRF
ncbi:MAG: DUF560 domain-containing protein [Alphaproteobacteria bacterium]|nr:DUF560 domain-containing protein [Alphaproteobacteria bacterium]